MCMSFSHCVVLFFFFKQKTAYEMRISDWSSDVCSSDLSAPVQTRPPIDLPPRSSHHRAMTLHITPSGQACGARVTGVDLTRPLDAATVADIRAAWLDHHVLAFPDQRMNDDDLERFTADRKSTRLNPRH